MAGLIKGKTNTNALKHRIAIAGILNPLDPLPSQGRPQTFRRDFEQWSEVPQLRRLSRERHGGQTMGRTPMGLSKQKSLDLIALMVAKRQIENTTGKTGCLERLITSDTGILLQAPRTYNGVEPEDDRGDIERLQSERRLFRLGCGIVSQTMIDNERQNRTAPAPHQPGKAQTICPA